MVEELISLGVTPIPPTPKSNNGPLNNKTVVITGTLSKPRTAIESIIKSNGGKVIKSVSKSLNILLVGESAGSKLTKANELNINGANIQVMTETEFNNYLNE